MKENNIYVFSEDNDNHVQIIKDVCEWFAFSVSRGEWSFEEGGGATSSIIGRARTGNGMFSLTCAFPIEGRIPSVYTMSFTSIPMKSSVMGELVYAEFHFKISKERYDSLRILLSNITEPYPKREQAAVDQLLHLLGNK